MTRRCNYLIWSGIRGTPRSHCCALAFALSLLALTGCADSAEGQHGEDHVGHTVPAHKPKSFPKAIVSLRALNHQIDEAVSKGDNRSLLEGTTVFHAVDVANWLPEIAADSDMPETEWNQANLQSGIIVSEYQKILANPTTSDGSPAPKRTAVERAGRSIAELEALLERSNLHWFDQPRPPVTAPSSISEDRR